MAYALALTAIYLCVDVALNKFAFSDGWTILWPLNGITVAILIRRPRIQWPVILTAVAVGVGIGECLDHNTISLEICLRFCSVTEVFLAALLLPAFTTLDQWLRRARLFLRFNLALAVGPGVSGIMAALVYHHFQHQPYLLAFNNWATADALGNAAMMPLALAFDSSEMRTLFRRQSLPKTLLLLASALALIFLTLDVSRYPLLFLLYPTLLFIDLMLSFSGSAIVAAGGCFIAIYLTVHGHGPFGIWNQNQVLSRDVALQVFLGFHMVALFPASIIFRERRVLVDDLHSTNLQLLMLASLDGLTGIPNRRSHEERFFDEWRRGIRLRTPLTLLMVDVDQFKPYNDLYGHRAGDECLRTVATALETTVRRPQDSVARFGGEEFAIVLPHTDTHGGMHMAELLRHAVWSLQMPHQQSPFGVITVSIGCATVIPTLEGTHVNLLELADAALYSAKRAGRNRVQLAQAIDQHGRTPPIPVR